MTTPEQPTGSSLTDQVDTANAAVQREAETASKRPAAKPPVDRRPLAVVAVIALAITLWMSKDRLMGGAPDPAVLRGGMQEGIKLVASFVQARWNETGALPVALNELGLGELPLTYSSTGDAFRLVGITSAGDTITYESPARPAAEGRQ